MNRTLTDMFRSSAERCPESEAIVHGARRVSYAQLWHEATAIAGFLRGEGMQPGERVALLLENSTAYAAAYYGVLMAHGVVVALNTAARARDLSNWLLHSESRWLIADAAHPELKQTMQTVGALRLIAVGDAGSAEVAVTWQAAIQAGQSGAIASAPADTALASIIYTSGTTGRPKGVMLSHANLAANVASILSYLELGSTDRCVNVLPFYYSYGNSVLHTHLAAGGTLVLENSLVYVHNVVRQIDTERATGFSGVPSTYALILNRVKLGDFDLSSLRYVTQAGGAMATTHVRKLCEALPHTKLFVMYGQTEATARLSYVPPEQLEQRPGSAGIPIPGVRLEIRDDNGTPVPSGTTGEIYASGANVMMGYWKDAAASAEVLHDGWLRTGDLAYMDDDGYLFIQGRSSDMIKSGAHRINPRDIEEVIEALDGVAEVAVVGAPDELLGQSIKAVIVVAPGAVLTAMAVKAHCRAGLASYKIPHAIEFVTQIPRTASGKIQRYLLSNDNTGERLTNA